MPYQHSREARALAESARQVVLEQQPHSRMCGGMEEFAEESLDQGTLSTVTPPSEVARQYLRYAVLDTGLFGSTTELKAHKALDGLS